MTPSIDDVIREVKNIIEELTSVPVGELREEDSLSEILAGDSLRMIECKIALEQRFDISLDLVEWQTVDSIRSIASSILAVINKS